MGPFWSMQAVGDSDNNFQVSDVTQSMKFTAKLWKGHLTEEDLKVRGAQSEVEFHVLAL